VVRNSEQEGSSLTGPHRPSLFLTGKGFPGFRRDLVPSVFFVFFVANGFPLLML
jgi:hypothetical protein